jgi:predicted nucleic acid-binding protein
VSAYLFDTSALAKHYHPEVGSSSVDALLATSGMAHFVSRLSAVEIHSVLAKKVREGVLSSNDLERLRRRFLFDVHAGTISILRMASSLYGLAQQLLIKHGPTRKLLTLDALQLAVAIDTHARLTLKGFVVADIRLEELANAEGLPTVNPDSPATVSGP